MLKKDQNIKIVPNNVKFSATGKIVSLKDTEITIETSGTTEISESADFYVSGNNCMLFFKTEILKNENNQIILKYPQDIKRIQRREYTRVEVNLPVKCSCEEKSFPAETLNISGGGMKFKTTENIVPQKTINLTISIGKDVNTDIELLEVQDNQKIFTASGWFKNINNTDRIFIVQYCFKKELELKCTGLGGHSH